MDNYKSECNNILIFDSYTKYNESFNNYSVLIMIL